jgi:DNA polymerase-3 subunit gamma/tau
MSQSLYQKYRPKQFTDLVGQDHIRTTLLNELVAKAPSHAYVFSGSRGVGKTTTARIVARAVNCLQSTNGEPCNTCENCSTILAGKALDIIEIDAASHTGVDHVRENIIENARVAPTRLPWKVFIIDEVHMLSTSAFNALLKTLEEPPSHTMFILATTELHKVPATILSRCEQFQFKRVSYTHVVERLAEVAQKEGVMVDRPVLEAIARRSEGAMRDAESLLGQVLSLHDTHVTAEMAEIILPSAHTQELLVLFEEIVRLRVADAIEHVTRLVDAGVQIHEFNKELIEFLRSVLLYRVQKSLVPLENLNLHAEQLQPLSELAGELSVTHIARMIEVFLVAGEQYKTAAIPQLPLELAIVKVCDTHFGADAAPAARKPVAKPAPAGNAPVATTPVKKSAPTTAGHTATMATGKRSTTARTDASEVGSAEKAEQPTGPVTLTFTEIQERWSKVLEEMRHRNHSLHLSLQVGTLVSFDGRAVVMGFQYQFYQDRLNDARNRPIIEEVLSQVLGGKVFLETVVGKEYARNTQSANSNIEQPTQEEVANVWDLAATSFGSTGS